MFFKKAIDPAAGAIIMATGVFLFGAIEFFPLLDDSLGEILAIILVVSTLIILSRITAMLTNKDFRDTFFKQPVRSFAAGTWIAGIAVMCDVLIKYFPSIQLLIQIIALVNIFLWIGYMIVCSRNFFLLVTGRVKDKVHGIVLLSTVGTQSIVILIANSFDYFPLFLFRALIILGLLSYLVGVVLITKRYLGQRDWNLMDDWANTNCIIHGALSITGLAIVITSSFSTAIVIPFWGVVFALLVIVEVIEVIRSYKRIRSYGWVEGILTYNVTQWSRNFTFGMFFTFTLLMQRNSYYHIPEEMKQFQDVFLSVWAWIVLVALAIEIIIYRMPGTAKLFSRIRQI